LSVYQAATDGWKMVPGAYTFMVGGSSQELPLAAKISIP
jgi:beta-glucosidase